MSNYPELYLHIKTLNFFGLISCECRQDKDKKLTLITLRSHDIKAKKKLFIAVLGCLIMLIYCILCHQDFYISVFTETGNHHSILLFECGCLLIPSFYVYLYVTRLRNICFLKVMLNYYNDLWEKDGAKNVKPSRRQFFIYLEISLLSLVISVMSYRQGLTAWSSKLCLMVLHSSVTSIVGIVNSFYVSIVKIFVMAMKNLNEELCESENLISTQNILERRSQLMFFCFNDLNKRFGLLLLLTVAYTLLLAPSGPYLVISRFLQLHLVNDIWTIIVPSIITFCWSIPWIVIFVMMSQCGGLTIE
uniref:Gustatory receptor n=1 Tax=Stomoxys calcitrans TaxID=35570 RepID=A0A905ST61_STOCA